MFRLLTKLAGQSQRCDEPLDSQSSELAKTLDFSNYVSLGSNCEIAFQFRRILGRESSSFFSWNVTSFAALSSLLSSRFSGILEEQNLSPHGHGMVRDNFHDYLFHTPFSTPNPSDDPDFAKNLANHRSKARYLIDKFTSQAASGEPIVYFYRTEEEDAKAKAMVVRDSLAGMHHRDNFRLVIIQAESRREDDWQEACIANRYVLRLAPFNDATDGHVSSYDRIFREFPFSGEMRYSGY